MLQATQTQQGRAQGGGQPGQQAASAAPPQQPGQQAGQQPRPAAGGLSAASSTKPGFATSLNINTLLQVRHHQRDDM